MGLQRVGHDWESFTFTFPPRTVLLPKDHVLFYCTTIFLVFQLENVFPFYFDIQPVSRHYSQIPHQWTHPWLNFVTAKSFLVLFQSSSHAQMGEFFMSPDVPSSLLSLNGGPSAFLSQLQTAKPVFWSQSAFCHIFPDFRGGFSWGFCCVKGPQTTVPKRVYVALLRAAEHVGEKICALTSSVQAWVTLRRTSPQVGEWTVISDSQKVVNE